MKILIVEDEKLTLMSLKESVEKILPDHALSCFDNAEDALVYARNNPVDAALLDIELTGMSGLHLALHLKKINPKTNIIFVTGYADYAGNAFSMHASGYVLKPVSTTDIAREFHNLRYPVEEVSRQGIRMHCFGNFTVTLHGKPFPITRPKLRELLAYLVYKNGSAVSKKEIAAVVWEDKEYTRSLQYQIQKSISRLENKFMQAGVEGLFIRHWGLTALDTTMYTSDYMDFLNGDVRVLNEFNGEYMAEYSWAELTAGTLLRFAENKKT